MKNGMRVGALICMTLMFVLTLGRECLAQSGKIREPKFAGKFYPSNPEELKGEIGRFLKFSGGYDSKGQITALILPHAEYEFSGKVIASGVKELIGEKVDTVIIIGDSHYDKFDGISVAVEGYYKTPLGNIKIDSELARAIVKENKKIHAAAKLSDSEHSVEVELPFLQEALKDFKIVPIYFGATSDADYKILADAILKNIEGKNILLIASSDLSHYPSQKAAKRIDRKIIRSILTGDVSKLDESIVNFERKGVPQLVTYACGIDAIRTVMTVEKAIGSNKTVLFKYSTSGDVSQDHSRVVGYAAIGFFGDDVR